MRFLALLALLFFPAVAMAQTPVCCQAGYYSTACSPACNHVSGDTQLPFMAWGDPANPTVVQITVWGGVGALNGGILAQAGVLAVFNTTNANPLLTVNVWYECAPAAGIFEAPPGLLVPGDKIHIDVDCTTTCAGTQTWTYTVQNVSRNWTYTRTQSCSPTRQDAELALEPQTSGSINSRANSPRFGNVPVQNFAVNGVAQTGMTAANNIYYYPRVVYPSMDAAGTGGNFCAVDWTGNPTYAAAIPFCASEPVLTNPAVTGGASRAGAGF